MDQQDSSNNLISFWVQNEWICESPALTLMEWDTSHFAKWFHLHMEPTWSLSSHIQALKPWAPFNITCIGYVCIQLMGPTVRLDAKFKSFFTIFKQVFSAFLCTQPISGSHSGEFQITRYEWYWRDPMIQWHEWMMIDPCAIMPRYGQGYKHVPEDWKCDTPILKIQDRDIILLS